MDTQSQAPVAPSRPVEHTAHGETRTDEYYWLRERTSPDVIAHLNAENAYTEQQLSSVQNLRQRLYDEMRGRIKEDDTSAPVRNGGYTYYTRTEAGQQYGILCRRSALLDDAPEEVVLDYNSLAAPHAYFRAANTTPSPDHRLLAFATDTSGSEVYTLFVKDLTTGELLADQIPGTYYGLAWGNDNQTIYYVTLDAASRPYKVFRHTLGTPTSDDAEVFHEPDELYYLGLEKTRSGAYIVATVGSFSTSEVAVLDANNPQAAFQTVHPREQGLQYTVDHQGDRFLIVTNADGAQNFKLMAAPTHTPIRANWHELLPHRPAAFLDSIDVFAEYIVRYEREDGLKRIRISSADFSDAHDVSFPEPVYTYSPAANEVYDTATLRFTYSSLVTPTSVVEYGMDTGAWQVVKQDELPSGYDASNYVSERLFAPSHDGVLVPMSLVMRRDTPLDGSAPLLLYGYGSYGFSIDPSFDQKRLSLLDRGVIFVIAHIRGGSEMGRAWYDDGKLLKKKNTFHDFVACADYLVANGYTTPARLAIMGRSAGGLLMGAVINMRPELFAAAVAGVPFVDVINTMSDPTIPLTVPEYEQWGNPADREYYEYMRSYSPYDNLAEGPYPHILATAGLNDPRVQYWEPAKWIARLRTRKTNDTLTLLFTKMEAGHGGASGRFDYLHDIALDYAFVLHCIGAEALVGGAASEVHA